MPAPIWWALGAIIAAVAAWEFRLHIWLPSLAQNMRGRGEMGRARALLETIVIAPSLLPSGKRSSAYQLAWLYMEEKRFVEAIDTCRRLLGDPSPAGFRALVRNRLADCLDATGEAEEAAGQRRLAAEELEHAPANADVLMARGREHTAQKQHERAAEQYEAALDKLPRWDTATRIEVLVWLALAHFNAGNPEETSRRGEEAVALRPTDEMLMTAHSIAAVGYSTRRLPEEAEAHRRAAFTIAERAGNEDRAASYLAGIGASQRSRGNLLEALQTADRAASMSLKHRRQARVLEAECLRATGRWEASRRCWEQAREAQPYLQATEERRSQSTLMLGQAQTELEAGNLDAAMRLFTEAEPELREDPKFSVWLDAAIAPLLAEQGRAEEARALVAAVEARLSAFDKDIATQERGWYGIGRTLLALNEPERARGAWLRCLATPPEPVDRPEGYYYLAQCEQALNNPAAAAEAYRSGARLCPETRYSRLCAGAVKDL